MELREFKGDEEAPDPKQEPKGKEKVTEPKKDNPRVIKIKLSQQFIFPGDGSQFHTVYNPNKHSVNIFCLDRKLRRKDPYYRLFLEDYGIKPLPTKVRSLGLAWMGGVARMGRQIFLYAALASRESKKDSLLLAQMIFSPPNNEVSFTKTAIRSAEKWHFKTVHFEHDVTNSQLIVTMTTRHNTYKNEYEKSKAMIPCSPEGLFLDEKKELKGIERYSLMKGEWLNNKDE